MKKLMQFLLLGLVLLFTACQQQGEIPGLEMTKAQKKSAFLWYQAHYETNYAPLAMKLEDKIKEKTGDKNMTFEKLSKRFLRKAVNAKDNQEFRDIVRRYVATFADAHNSVSWVPSNTYPGLASVYYTGPMGVRHGENFFVEKIHPMVSGTKNFPIEPGDEITHIGVENKNGKVKFYTVLEYIDKFLTNQKDVGQKQSNYTILMNAIFNRSSLSLEAPTAPSLWVKVKDGDKGKNVKLDWIERDIVDYKVNLKKLLSAETDALEVEDTVTGKKYRVVPKDYMGREIDLAKYINRLQEQPSASLSDIFEKGFQFDVGISHLDFVDADIDPVAKSAFDKLKKVRYVPDEAMPIQEAQTYPAYIYPKKDSKGNVKHMGYIRIDTYSPGKPEKVVIEELKTTIRRFQDFGVEDIVIDQTDNGGGSLRLVMNVVQAFSNKPVKHLGMQLRFNNSWVDNLKDIELAGPGQDAEKQALLNLKKRLDDDMAAGKEISSVFGLDELMPFSVPINDELEKPFNMVVLVNEMDASSADISAAMFKLNDLGVLKGTRTMGAGGNVVSYIQNGNDNGKISMTESLLVYDDGVKKSYIENAGVTPHIVRDTTKEYVGKFESLISDSFELLSNRAKFKQIKKKVTGRTKLNEDCLAIIDTIL